MLLSTNIKMYRKSKNYTQEELAQKLNISRQSISKWETGQSLPSIQNLILLSEILEMPLDLITGKDSELPFPINFNKPKTILPLITWLFFPILFFYSFLVTKEVSMLASGIFILFLIYGLGLYDFKRYYSYFILEEKSITVLSGKPFCPFFPFLSIIKGAIGRRKERYISFNHITSAEVLFDTHGFKGFGTVVSYRPRQFYNVREMFFLRLSISNGEILDLDLDQVFYSESKERKYLIPLVYYLKRQKISVKDNFQIIESIQKEIDFVDRAYDIQSSKPNNYIKNK